jgi:hypothetical protein
MIRTGRNNSATVLSVRLAQEHPKYYEAYLRGDYRSVTAAAIAAGLLKNDVNLRRLKSAWRKATAPEREQFLEWIKTEQPMTDEERAATLKAPEGLPIQ